MRFGFAHRGSEEWLAGFGIIAVMLLGCGCPQKRNAVNELQCGPAPGLETIQNAKMEENKKKYLLCDYGFGLEQFLLRTLARQHDLWRTDLG